MMALPPPITWPITGGIATKNAPFALTPPGHLTLDNVRMERKDEWRTRAGFTHAAADDLPGASVPVLLQESNWGGLVGLVRATTYGTSVRTYSPNAGTRWTSPNPDFAEQLTPAMWSRTSAYPSSVIDTPGKVSAAQGGNCRLAASWTRVIGTPSIEGVLQTIDGVTISALTFFNAQSPRCVYASAANMLVLLYVDSAHAIQATCWNATTGVLVQTKTISTVAYTGGSFASFLDVIDYGGSTITIAYRNNTGTGNLEIAEYNVGANTVTLYPQAVSANLCLSLMPDPDASGTRAVALSNSTDTRVIRLNSVGVIQTNQLVETVTSYNITGVLYNAGVDWMVVYHNGFSTSVSVRAVKRRSGVTSSPVDVIPAVATVAIMTCAWREPGTDAMRYLVCADSRDPNNDPQPTYMEMALEFENGSSSISNTWNEPQSRMLSLNAAGDTVEQSGLAQVYRLGTDKFLTGLARITRNLDEGSAVLNETVVAVDVWQVSYLNGSNRYTLNRSDGASTRDCTFLNAGILLQTATGGITCGHGAHAIPYKPTLTPQVGLGTLNPAKSYTYGVSCIMYDENGNEWRSPMSVTTAGTPGGANNSFDVAWNLTAMEVQERNRTVLIWRTDGNGSTFKLLKAIVGTVGSTISGVYSDVSGDVIAGELFSGEVQTGLTPAFIHTEVWNGRMWGVDRDFPTKLWFSKPLSQGLLPEFVSDPATGVDFNVDIVDEYGPITGIRAMDDKLVVFKKRATYVLGGDGPLNNGDGSFPIFSLIDAEVGNIPGGPTVSTGREVYCVSMGGVYRVGVSQENDFVGAAIDRYLGMPLIESPETVTGMVISPSLSEIRIQTTSYRFVHDRLFDLWIRDTGGMAAASGIVATKMLGGATQVVITSAGQMWQEAADSNTPNDAGTPFHGIVRSAWIKPSGTEGQLRLYRARVLGECTAVGVVSQPTFTIFYNEDDTLFEAFQPLGSISSATGPIRAEGQPRQQICTAFSLQLDLPVGDATIRLDAWSAAAASLPGALPLATATKWQSVSAPAAPASPIIGASMIEVPTYAALGALSSATLNAGQLALVDSGLAIFILLASSVSTRAGTRIAASGKSGYQWVRLMIRNPVWEVAMTWVIDPANSTGLASNDNSGADATHPLLTYEELGMRLADAVIGQNVSVSVLGDQQAGDEPTFSYRTRAAAQVSWTGTPTLIWQSTVTSHAEMTVGVASVDDAELGDTGLATSFAASGGLARGVIYKRTNGTVVYWFGTKDLGSKTLRTSQFYNPLNRTSQPALVNGDTYQALRLPKILNIRFLYDTGATGSKLNFFDMNTSGFQYGLRPWFENCYFSADDADVGGIFYNCCFDIPGGSLSFFAAGQSPIGGGVILGGCMKGTGADTYALSQSNWSLEGQIFCLQGARILNENATVNLQQVNVCDSTSANGALNSGTGGRIHLTSVISGKNSTGALVCAGQGSQILWTAATVLNAGSTSVNPYKAGTGTSAAPIPLNANMNGVFQTA